jgi:hypothetical protein
MTVNVSFATHLAVLVAVAMGVIGLGLQGLMVGKAGTWRDRAVTIGLGLGLAVFSTYSLMLVYFDLHVATPALTHTRLYTVVGVLAFFQLARSAWRLRDKTDKWRHARLFTTVLCVLGAAILALSLQLLLDSAVGARAGAEGLWISILGWAAIVWGIPTAAAWFWDGFHKVPTSGPKPAAADQATGQPETASGLGHALVGTVLGGRPKPWGQR